MDVSRSDSDEISGDVLNDFSEYEVSDDVLCCFEPLGVHCSHASFVERLTCIPASRLHNDAAHAMPACLQQLICPTPSSAYAPVSRS